MIVGFLDDVGSTGRAPPCNCRARLAATMMKRYVLCSGSSGRVQCALLRGGLFSAIRHTSTLKCFQNRPDLVFNSAAPGSFGANDRAQSGFGLPQIPVDQYIIVIFVLAHLFSRFLEPPRDHISAIFTPRAEPLLQYGTGR